MITRLVECRSCIVVKYLTDVDWAVMHKLTLETVTVDLPSLNEAEAHGMMAVVMEYGN
jgi:hypothetical protein